ncbi:hypothetical protein BGP_0068 [Beggiatoa sp. PS]|nr:hypothetical protein BGP_0068 [Beggiatoa sp. PS]
MKLCLVTFAFVGLLVNVGRFRQIGVIASVGCVPRTAKKSTTNFKNHNESLEHAFGLIIRYLHNNYFILLLKYEKY